MKMKVKNFLAMMMAACVMTGMTACSSDDDDVEPDLTQAVVGSYTGYGNYGSAYFTDMYYTGLTVSVARHEQEKAVVDVTFEGGSLGTYTFEQATVAQNGSTYVVTGEGTALLASHSGNAQSYEATLKAVITSTDDFEIVLATPTVMGGSTLTILPGEAPAASGVAGSYSGYGLYGSAYFSNMLYLDKTVKVEAVEGSNTKVNVTMEDAALGTYTFENADVIVDAGTYTITGNGKAVMNNHSGGTSEYDATLSATVSSRSYEFILGTPTVMGGSTLTVKSGDVPYAYGVATTANGTSVANAAYFQDYVVEGETATLTVVADSEDAAVADIVYASTTWGTFTFDNAAVSYDPETSTYTVTGAGTVEMAGMGGEVSTYECTVEGSVAGRTSTWNFVVPAVMGGTTVTFVPASTGR